MSQTMTAYTTKGSVCGGCGHAHKTIRAALACADRHHAAVRRGNPGGRAYSDRQVVRSDGEPLSETECATLCLAAELFGEDR